MFAWVGQALVQTSVKKYVFEPSRPVQFLRTGNAQIARKPHATTPFRITGRTEQSRLNKLSIGHPSFRGVTPKAPMTSAASFQPSQRAHGRPLKEDTLNMPPNPEDEDASLEIILRG